MDGSPQVQAPQLLDDLKQRPEVASLIRGGQTVEYSAHVIPEGGLKALTKLYGNGILVAGDAAGFSMNIGVTVRGMEYALASGYYAAQAVLKAREAGQYTANQLSVYELLLKDSFVMKDFQNFKDAPTALDNPRFFTVYPEMVTTMMSELYAVDDGPKERIYPTIKKHLTIREMWDMLGDFRKVRKL
jgi:electron transfer flavoprotein-quinone oxidoreductase